MKCEGNFVYKSLEARDGGEFTNDKGQLIKYNPMYLLKVDEVSEGKINGRTFKFSQENIELANKIKILNPYEEIVINFEIELYNSSVKLVPIDVMSERNVD